MINWDEIINPKNWTEDCPMLNETYINFFNSNKQYLVAYQDKNGNYGFMLEIRIFLVSSYYD